MNIMDPEEHMDYMDFWKMEWQHMKSGKNRIKRPKMAVLGRNAKSFWPIGILFCMMNTMDLEEHMEYMDLWKMEWKLLKRGKIA